MKKLNQNDQLLDKCLKEGLNICFQGRHGTGKTSVVLAAFKRAGLKYLYFSASTMDPWVDFIGVPREQKDDHGTFLELVRPKHFRDDDIEALFIDEYNRAPRKVRNAVMELIQFKSINGHRFDNLKVVWTAINPDDGNYDTEGMDPAQQDRFQIHIEVPFRPDPSYFAEKFGSHWADAAISWWKELPADTQDLISPRRLDYALDAHRVGIELRGLVLPKRANVSKLLENLSRGPVEIEFQRLMEKKDARGMRKFLQDENNYSSCEHAIAADTTNMQFCIPLLEPEKQTMLVAKFDRVSNYVFSNPAENWDLVERIATQGQNADLRSKAESIMTSKWSRTNDPFADLKTMKTPRVSADIKWHDPGQIKVTKMNTTITSLISRTDVQHAETTQKRMKLISIMDNCGSQATLDEAIYGLQILDFVAAKSHPNTLIDNREFVRVLNNICWSLEKQGFTVEDFNKMAPYVMGRVVTTMINDGKPTFFAI